MKFAAGVCGFYFFNKNPIQIPLLVTFIEATTWHPSLKIISPLSVSRKSEIRATITSKVDESNIDE